MKRWIKGIVVVVAIAAIGGIVLATRNDGVSEHLRTVIAEREDLVQDVAFTGRLRSAHISNLGFEVSGVVNEVMAGVGDAVAAGDVIATLNTDAAALNLSKATADKVSAQEELRLAWQKAEDAWENAKKENAQLIDRKRQAVIDAKAELDQAQVVWERTKEDDGEDATTTASAYKAYLAAKSIYNAAQEGLTETRLTVNAMNGANRSTADIAKEQYTSTTQAAGTFTGLSSLEALEEVAGVTVAKYALRAPYDGIITQQTLERGDVVAPAQHIATLETTGQLELAADVAETDAIKIEVGMTASVTFDVFPETETWKATVTRIAPSAVITEGVPSYEIILELQNPRDRVIPGLTANVTVHAATRDNVFAIPRRAVTIREKEEFINILESDGSIREQRVTTGLLGSNGSIEITSGLSDGEEVIVRLPEE